MTPAARALALGAGLLAVLAPFVWSSGWREDELSYLANAARMLGGEVMYRDYFELNAPLTLWLTAGVFAVVGPSLLAARLLVALAVAAAAGLAAHLVRRLGGGPVAGAVAAFALVLGAFRAFPVWNHHWFALAFALGAVALVLRGLERPAGRGWLAAGALAGACLMSTQSDGVALAAALGLMLPVLAWLGPWDARQALQAGGRLAAGLAAVVGATALVLALQGALDDAWRCAWVWPRAHYQAAGGVNDLLFGHDLGPLVSPANGPWPGRAGFLARLYHVIFLFGLVPAAALAALTWGLGAIAARLREGSRLDAAQARWGVLALATLAFTALALRGRADYPHVAFYAPWALVLAAAAADRLRAPLAALTGRAVAALPLAALAAFVGSGAVVAVAEARLHPGHWLSATPPDARLADAEVIRWIRANTRPGDRIVALPQGSLAYFYGRPSAADMNVMLPPRHKYTDEADFRALWRRIAEREPALILVTPDHPDEAELAEHLRYPLPAYEQAAVVETPYFDGVHKTWIFRRKAAPSRPPSP